MIIRNSSSNDSNSSSSSSSNNITRSGAKDCTPEIDTSEVIVDLQRRSPMALQWHFQTDFHVTAVCSKGLSLPQWIFTGIVQWTFGGNFQQHVTFVVSGV